MKFLSVVECSANLRVMGALWRVYHVSVSCVGSNQSLLSIVTCHLGRFVVSECVFA